MLNLKKTLQASLVVTAVAFASQGLAHGVEKSTVTLPVIAPGGSTTVTITCSGHHYARSGGFENNDQLLGARGPLEVTGSYPASTRSWAVEVTNNSGRPTAINEARATIYAMCGYRH